MVVRARRHETGKGAETVMGCPVVGVVVFEQKCEGCGLCPRMHEEHLAGARGTCRDPVVGMCLARVRVMGGWSRAWG